MNSTLHTTDEERLIEFIQKYCYIFETPNNQFFSAKVYSLIDQEWLSFLAGLNYDELNRIPTGYAAFAECPQTLIDFFREAVEVTHLTEFVDENDDSHVIASVKHVKAKKVFELHHFCNFLTQLCRENGITRVVDVGCGLGHLTSALNANEALKCVGVEADGRLCGSAKCRSKGDIIRMKFERDNAEARRLLCESDASSGIVSLHGCGDLQCSLLREFVSISDSVHPTADESSGRVGLPPKMLITIGCCYHKMNDSESWPMSAQVRDLLPPSSGDDNRFPYVTGLRLACQERMARWRRYTHAEHDAHRSSFIDRALAECVYRDMGAHSGSDGKRSKNRRFGGGDASALLASLLERNAVSVADAPRWADSMSKAIRQHQTAYAYIEPFAALQFAMQGPLETLVLWDRILFLRERGCVDAELRPMFHSWRSPRNMCIIAKL